MEKEGKYIYCIIASNQERTFGPIGIGNRNNDVATFGYNDLSVVLSGYPLTNVVVNRENMLAHQRVVETVMKEFESVIPIRFGTVANSFGEIRNLLDRRYREFKTLLRNMEHKVELGVKGSWCNMENIFKEIVEENKDIKKMKTALLKESNSKSINTRVEIGRKVEHALNAKKEKETEWVIEKLKRSAIEYKLNTTIGDEMFINAAFLVDKGREKEFDNIMAEMGTSCGNRIRFMYAGPLPVYNFINVTIYSEKWER